MVAYFITLSSWSPPYARPRGCYGISHRKVSSLCLHSAALITAKTTAGASAGMLDVDAILPGGGAKPLHDLSLWCALYARAISFSATIHSSPQTEPTRAGWVRRSGLVSLSVVLFRAQKWLLFGCLGCLVVLGWASGAVEGLVENRVLCGTEVTVEGPIWDCWTGG